MKRCPGPRSAASMLVALLLMLVGWASPALAHAELDSTVPADGSSVDAMPRAVVLRFTEGIRAPAAVTVVGPSGHEVTAGDPVTLGPALSQKLSLRTDGSGQYVVPIQVMSDATPSTVSGGGRHAAAPRFDDGSGVDQPAVLLLGLALLGTLGLAAAG